MARKDAEEWKKKGLCICCGGEIEPERKGKQKCAACSKKISDWKKKTRAYCRRHGLCTKCHKKLEPERRDKYLCASCAKRQGEYQKASNKRKKERESQNLTQG